MIDKNGKLFGKINLIDLLIILVIIAAAVFFATKAFTPAQEAAGTETGTVQVQFFSSKAPVGTAEAIELGAPAFEDTTNVQVSVQTSRCTSASPPSTPPYPAFPLLSDEP